MSVLNPAESKVTSISALTEYDDEPLVNASPSNATIVYQPYYDNLAYIEITIISTRDNSKPSKLQLSILGCANPGNMKTKPQLPTTPAVPSSLTTSKKCEEMQAVDESTSKKITVSPTDVTEGQKTQFQPTSPQGVSFPENEKTPTITFTFGKPSEVQSIVIPRDKTPNANVQQFEMTFYSPDGKKINENPISSTTSPKDDNKKPASLDWTQIPSNTPVSRVEIKLTNTTDGQSPKGVVLDIKACTEPTTGTTVSGATFGTTVSETTPGTTVSGATPGTTTKRCEEMQTVDETTSKKITVLPTDVPAADKPKFQPTSPQGVSFPENETKPTIVFTFDKPAEVQSVVLPRDKTPNANVEYFEVTLYSPDGNKINDKPIPSTSSPKDDKTKPPTVDTPQIPSDKPVSRIEITIVNTTDARSPKDVVLDIKACTEPTTGTTVSGQTRGTTVSGQTPGTTISGATPGTTVSGQTPGTTVNGATPGTTVSGGTPGTTTKRCEEMQAVDEPTSKKITVLPTDVPVADKPKFQPTSPQGVSFPENETRPTIVFTFDKPAEVQSVILPRDKTPNAKC